MIVTDRFVFVHMHKTGGQTINRIIAECIPGHRVIGYHYPFSEVPDEAADLPIVGMVRNPWDWYVSWYAFNQRPGIRNQLFNVVSAGGTAGFKSTVANLVRLGSDTATSAAQREQLATLLPDTLAGNRASGLTRSCMQELAAADTGYLSWLCDRMLGISDDGPARVGRFENLRDDFLSIMSDLGVPAADAMRAEFDNRKRENVSRHSHYSHYYDDDLRELVAAREYSLIDRFGYAFEGRKPQGVSYAFPDDAGGGQHGFNKLLGREAGFLRLNDTLDVDAIREKVAQIPAERWSESDRRKIFNVHRDTEALMLVHFEDYKYDKPEYRELYYEFRDAIGPVVDYIADYYSNNGFIVRAMLAKLDAGGSIPRHTDAGFSLMNCHRVHVPIITNDEVEFFVGGETRHMRAGELWEINNAAVHAVANGGGEDRVHLIIDWMPNFAGRPEAEVLAADRLEGQESAAANAEMLASIIGRANQQHRAGQLARAEALYRQVLHFDAKHVVANNLMGLICLQTRRFDEAVRHIETALNIAPDDAQAHANLGLALKECGRPEDAVDHFRESLRLAPDNPKVLNNLGSLHVVLGQAEEAIACFRGVLAIEPDYAEVHFNLGNVLLHLQHYEEAAASLQQCITLRPDFVAAGTKLEKALRLLEAQRLRP